MVIVNVIAYILVFWGPSVCMLFRHTPTDPRVLTQSFAPTIKEAPETKAVIGPLCVLQADG